MPWRTESTGNLLCNTMMQSISVRWRSYNCCLSNVRINDGGPVYRSDCERLLSLAQNDAPFISNAAKLGYQEDDLPDGNVPASNAS